MHLQEVTLEGLSRLANVRAALPFDAQKPTPLFVTGPSAAGKTSFLEAIVAAKEAIAPYGMPPRREDWATEFESARAALKWALSSSEAATVGSSRTVETTWELRHPRAVPDESAVLRSVLGGYSRSPASWKMEYFHAGRAAQTILTSPMLPDPVLRNGRLTRQTDKYSWVRSFLEQAQAAEGAALTKRIRESGVVIAGAEPPLLQGFTRNISLVCPRLRWLGAERKNGGWACLFARKTGETVELSSLSGSESAAVLVAAAYEALGLTSSLILIDSPEQGLHPEDHVSFFEGLSNLGNAQIIAATTSPALLRSAPRERVLVLRDR